MPTVRPGPGGSGSRDWPGDVELDLLLLSAHEGGLQALAQVIDTEQGLAASRARQPTGDEPGPQPPGYGQLPAPATSRSPPPAEPRTRDQKPASHQRNKRRSTP
jgi:hypothetical protein